MSQTTIALSLRINATVNSVRITLSKLTVWWFLTHYKTYYCYFTHNMHTPHWVWGILFLVWDSPPTFAQNFFTDSVPAAVKEKSLFSVGLGVQHGFIFAHSEEVQNTKGARPTGIEAVFSWQRNDEAIYNLCHCYPRQGLLLAFYDYDVGILGNNGTAAYFLEPTYRISNRVLFSFKGALGFSYLDNPYHPNSNPTNQSYSTYLSAYLLVGVGAWVQLSERWWLNPNVSYQHISNGGTRQPNKGINWPTAGITVSYQPVSRPWYSNDRNKEKYWKNYSNRYNISLLGTVRRGYNNADERARYAVGGFAFQAGRQVGSLSMLTIGAEVYYDYELKSQLRSEGLDVSPMKAGLIAGHEFLLGRFQFSQGLGLYVFDQTPYYDRLFHRWGLQYRINRQISAGVNLLAHRQVAEFVDFRVTYTFQKRYK